jgi:hypothetical protein
VGANAYALRSDGTAWAWGYSLGDEPGSDRGTPVQVPDLNGVTAIAGAGSTMYAVKDGSPTPTI